MQLIQSYENLINEYSFLEVGQRQNVNKLIKSFLQEFTDSCTTPALWCYGKHTKMLMADFMFEMKRVRYIVDAQYENMEESGFCIIDKGQIHAYKIDGIIISSFLYREEIKEILKREYPELKYLDLYNRLQDMGVILTDNYFSFNHPYDYYRQINKLRKDICAGGEREKGYQCLINAYVMIKDFQSAISCAEELSQWKPEEQYCRLVEDLKGVYQLELRTLAGISSENVLMLCIDGLRRKDVFGDTMPGIKRYLSENSLSFSNAYSASTSTFESLIPAYSENNDLRTRYYEFTHIPEGGCRFICEAIRQERKIHFYTDSIAFIDSEEIMVEGKSQTATEKIWSFIADAQGVEKGLFYVHILYESHYSYPNPDTISGLVTDGSSIMFDYLKRNGGKLRTDYVQQHKDAIRYLDRVLTPFLDMLPCRMVLYADHGNILIPQGMQLSDVEASKYSYHEDLIQIPFAIKSPEVETGKAEELLSLMSINDIVLALLKKEPFVEEKKDYIKVQRSEIYNPDFRYLYKKNGQEQELKAFEVFLFKEGYKLVVYQDGIVKLCTRDDRLIADESKKKELFQRIEKEITVFKV